MKALVLTEYNHFELQDVAKPTIRPNEVLVRVQAVGICGSDVHYYDHGRIGPYVVEQPMVVGHEAAGRVIGVGDKVDRSRLGQLVALEPGVPCRSTPRSRTRG